MPRRSSLSSPTNLRARLQAARLDTLALLRALDQLPVSPAQLPQPETHQLFELDADCAEALWALDQPTGSLDFKAMLRDTLASLDALPDARQRVRTRLPPAATRTTVKLEQAIRAGLAPSEAYNDVPGRDPHSR